MDSWGTVLPAVIIPACYYITSVFSEHISPLYMACKLVVTLEACSMLCASVGENGTDAY